MALLSRGSFPDVKCCDPLCIRFVELLCFDLKCRQVSSGAYDGCNRLRIFNQKLKCVSVSTLKILI